VADHNGWEAREKATHLFADMLHNVPADELYDDTVRALKGRYRHYQLAAIYLFKPKAWTQLGGKSIQEFAAAVEQLALVSH
jgi:hypothetical protein